MQVLARLSGCPLSSTHPVKKESNDGAAPYRLAGAQLEAGGSHPMKLRGLLPPSDETPGAHSYANQSEFRTGKLPRSVLCQSLVTPLECPLQFALRPGWEDKEMLGCPYDSVTPARCNWLCPRERKNQYNLGLVPLQKLPEESAEHLPSALGAPLRICPRGYS